MECDAVGDDLFSLSAIRERHSSAAQRLCESLEAMPIKGCHVLVHDTAAAL